MKQLTADQIIKKANRKIVPLDSQKDATKQIATLISTHIKKINAMKYGADADELPIISRLFFASTGSGKTYLISKLAEAAGLKFYIIDASMLTPAGYKGINLNEAMNAARQNFISDEAFETAIFLFDEFDKIAFGHAGRDENYNPQADFLTLLEGRPIQANTSEKIIQTIDTSRMLFLFAGAFQGLDKIVAKRVNKPKTIGFNGSVDNSADNHHSLLAQATLDDIQEYGFNRELLGRIGSVQYIPPLEHKDYRTLIKRGNNSVQSKYETLLDRDVSITTAACDAVADIAIKRDLGARAVNSIIQEQLQPALYEVDINNAITGIALDYQNGRFRLDYELREPEPEPESEKTDEKSDTETDDPTSLTKYLLTETGLNRLCNLIMTLYRREEIEPESITAMYFFTQTALRFLQTDCNEDDQTLKNLVRFAKIAGKPGNKDGYSHFETVIYNGLMSKGASFYDFNKQTLAFMFNNYRATCLEHDGAVDEIYSVLKRIQPAIGNELKQRRFLA